MWIRKLVVLQALCLVSVLAACGGERPRGAATAAAAAAAAAPPATSAAALHGRLRVCGPRLCDASGAPVQLKGMSWSWAGTGRGGERFYEAAAVSSLVRGWGATVVRAAVDAGGAGGYLESPASASANTARVITLVDAAVASGVYVVVAWHESSGAVHAAQEQAFFQQLAARYAGVPNLIWETYAETGSVPWTSLKPHREAIISAIRAAGSQNLVLVGTPRGELEAAAASPITSDPDVAYAFHLHAGTDRQDLRDRASAALGRGIALFVTAWSTCAASGSGGVDASESQRWTTWMDANGVGSTGWALADSAEAWSALVPGGGASASGPWPDAQLTESGRWMKAYVSRQPPGTTYALAVSSVGQDGAAGTVTSAWYPVDCGASCSYRLTSGTVVTLTATASPASRFFGWGAPCFSSMPTCPVTMTQDRTVTATFVPAGTAPVTVTRTGSGAGAVFAKGGIDCGTFCAGPYALGARISLTATAAAGSVFTGWSGPCSGTGPCVFTVAAATEVGARFTAASDLTLRVAVAGTGSGRVASGAAGIDCPGGCAAALPAGTPVTLTASAAAGSTFGGWGGACAGSAATCTVIASPGLVVTATFELTDPSFPLTVTLAAAGYGQVTSTPPGIDCATSCTRSFAAGSTITLTAAATSGPGYSSTFAGWSGACAGTYPTCTIVMSQARAVTASFAAARAMYELTVTRGGSGEGMVVAGSLSCGSQCRQSYFVDTIVTLTAAAATGSTFAGWGGACSGTAATCAVILTQARAVTATFESIEPRRRLDVVLAGGGAGAVTSEGSGIGCTASCSVYLPAGAIVTLTAAAAPDSLFLGWSGACAGGAPTCTLELGAARAATATFQTTLVHPIAVTTAGPGAVTSTPLGLDCGPGPGCAYSFLQDTMVTLTATPASGAAFAGWTGECSGADPTCTLRAWGPRSAGAVFQGAGSFALAVHTTSALATDVRSTPAGIECGTTCLATFASGTTVTLAAASVREDGCLSEFTGWSGPCTGTGPCVLPMTQAREVTAAYETSCPRYTLEVARDGAGAGAVSASGGIECGATCSASYALDAVVTLTAAAEPGSTFAGWGGDCAGTAPTCTVTMAEARAVTATFALAPTGGCKVTYAVTGQWPGGFGAGLTIQNTGATPWTSWTVRWTFPDARQRVTQIWNARVAQHGPAVEVRSLGHNATLPAGGTYAGVGFNGTWSGSNPRPTEFSVNGIACE